MKDIQSILHGLDSSEDSEEVSLFDDLLDSVDFNNMGALEQVEALLEEILGEDWGADEDE